MSMSKIEAVQVLLAAALEERDEKRREAMVVGAKAVARLVAHRARSKARRADARIAAAAARQDAAPPIAGETPAPPEEEEQGTGAGPRAPVEDGELAEKARAEVRGLRELAEKLWEGSLMGESFMALRLEAFARRLAQAVGDEPGEPPEAEEG